MIDCRLGNIVLGECSLGQIVSPQAAVGTASGDAGFGGFAVFLWARGDAGFSGFALPWPMASGDAGFSGFASPGGLMANGDAGFSGFASGGTRSWDCINAPPTLVLDVGATDDGLTSIAY
jgi:hypothetical protein